jgi:hypothetical protein
LVASVAVSQLAFGLLGLLATSAHDRITHRMGVYVTRVVPASASVYVLVSAFDVLKANKSDQDGDVTVAIFSLVGALALVLVGIAWGVGKWVVRVDRKEPWEVHDLHVGRRNGEGPLTVVSIVLAFIGVGYFLSLLYIHEVAKTTWLAFGVTLVWATYAIFFSATCLGLPVRRLGPWIDLRATTKRLKGLESAMNAAATQNTDDGTQWEHATVSGRHQRPPGSKGV